MLRRPWLPALLVCLALPLGPVPAASASPAAGADARAAVSRCTTTALSARTTIRTEAGAKLGTTRIFATSASGDTGFCVRITPVDRLRKRGTAAFLRFQVLAPGEDVGPSSPAVAMSWKHPFTLTGVEPGSSVRVVATLRSPSGAKGSARVSATVS